jgi:uncharacterized glyoxalase superfamily metalloenzyme YdcJ
LQTSPFRVFTSLLRLELIENPDLRAFAESSPGQALHLHRPRALALIDQAESPRRPECQRCPGLYPARPWRPSAGTTPPRSPRAQYQQLSDQHRLIADVVAFKGPHINHLTPRTLDIDQRARRRCPAKASLPKP